MEKLYHVQDLCTDYILEVGSDNDYELCTEPDGFGNTTIQDEESLSQLLLNLGLMFLTNTEENMYYSLNNQYIEVPFNLVKYDDDIYDIYLDFDRTNIVNGDISIENNTLTEIRNKNISSSLTCMIENFLNKNNVLLSDKNIEIITEDIKQFSKDIFNKESSHESLSKTVSFASEIIDIVENVLSSEHIFIDAEERTGDLSEACIFGSVYYELENEISSYLDYYIAN